ncbi:MAG: FtsX-like permease family protein [Candidatus Thorarchaeota archaeon]
MSAVPAGYEAFHSRRRRSVTLLCFLLASTMAMGITVYVDSYSVHEWDANLDVGLVAIQAQGEGIENYVPQIRAIDGITKAVLVQGGYGEIELLMNSTYGQYIQYIDGNIMAQSQELMEAFAGYITVVEGVLPNTNSSQIAIDKHLSDFFGIEIGDIVNFTASYSGYNFNPVEIIGIYTQGSGDSVNPYYWYYESFAIVAPDVIVDPDYRVFIDIDRSRLTAFNAAGSLAFSNGIDTAIIATDPQYDPQYPWRSRFWVQNRISSGITTYMYWVSAQRISQLFRASSIIILIILVTFLAIRHNVNERRFESHILHSRGASQGDLDKIVNREIVILSLASCIFGIALGVGISRVALAATGFFKFDMMLMFTEPFLVSIESLIISIIAGIALPLLALGCYRIVYSTKKSVDEDTGRLSKMVKGLNFIKWDVLIVALSGLFLMSLISGGTELQSSPFVSFILPIIPLPLFLGVASLSIKGLRRSSMWISRALARIVGQIPASVGIRRIGKGASSGGAAAMVMVLAICLSWNSAIVDASLPMTKVYQAQLDVGADITFALDNGNIDLWDAFANNVTSHVNVTSTTFVSQTVLSLSSGYSGYKTFLAVNPREYSEIGYHYAGMRLNDSELASSIESLQTILDGAIISEDIAREYDLEIGDILRATDFSEEAIAFSFRVVGIATALPEMPGDDTFYYYDYYIVPPPGPFYPTMGMIGQERVMINREYLRTLYGTLNNTENFLCVSTRVNSNGTEIVNSLLESGGSRVLDQDLWESVTSERDEYLNDATYRNNRSVDTMMTVLTVGTIMGAFAIYAVEGVRARKREIALLRSTGADTGLIVRAQGAEMMILMLFSFVVLAGYSPLFLSTSVSSAGASGSFYVYPISVFPQIPWFTIFTVLAFFVISILLFIGIVSILSSRINLAETLNASWSEAAPYGEDL